MTATAILLAAIYLEHGLSKSIDKLIAAIAAQQGEKQ